MMNFKRFLFALGLLSGISAQATDDMVVLHECNFNDGIPSDYAIYDVDGQTHHYTMVQAGLDQGVAWTDLRELAEKGNRYAASTSKYKGDDVQPANDWLVTPRMRILSENAVIKWRAQSVCENSNQGDTYEVRVSTTGNRPEDFADAPVAFITGESVNKWTQREADLGKYVGKDVYIAFVNRSEMCEILAIDDVCVESAHGSYEVVDDMGTHVYGTEEHRISGLLRSNTTGKISDFTACCRIDGKEYRRQYTGIEVSIGKDFRFEFEETFNVPYGETLNYQLWAEIEGERSDTLHASFLSMLFDPYRRTVIEEGTGMWCGYCPLGIIAMERMKQKYADGFIGIAVHYDDLLEVEGYAREMDFSSFPIGWINRKLEVSPMVLVNIDGRMDYSMLHGGFETFFLEAQAEETMADVALTTSFEGQEIEVNAEARFAVPYSNSDYRFAFIVVEDKKEGKGFYQANYLNGMVEYSVGEFAELDDKIVPYVFDDVAIQLVGTTKGFAGSVPATIVEGETYSFQQRFEVPNMTNAENTRVVVLLLDGKTGHVINANQCLLTTTGIGSVEQNAKASTAIYDLFGRRIHKTPAKGFYIQNGKKYFAK